MEIRREKKFEKYNEKGNFHWIEMFSKDIRVFNAYHQARYKWILRMAGNLRGKRVLDLGCGDGLLTYFLAQVGAVVVGVDNEEEGLKHARLNLERMNKKKHLQYEFVNASVYELPFEDNSFDVVVSCEVIEHLDYPEKMIGEASRVLKSGGMIVVTTPHRLTEFPGDPHHVREYFPGEIEGFLKGSFKDIEIKQTHHMLWQALYGYAFQSMGRRSVGRWGINMLVFLFGWNPFMIDYKNPQKLDYFSSICAKGIK